jgi:2-haloalkanoic acid dehalogenase type II
MPRWDVITFDCYGTLVDWELGIGEAFRGAIAASGAKVDAAAALAAYHEIEPVVEAEPFRCYRDVLTETTRRVAARLGWALPEREASFLADSLPTWPPFPDTNDALSRLAAAGCRLGILSNVDDDLLAGTLGLLAPSFDATLIVTAQQVGSYKPAPGHFEEARRRIGGHRWLHAAQSLSHDIVATRHHGIPSAWINRQGQTLPGVSGASVGFRTVAELAAWVTGG